MSLVEFKPTILFLVKFLGLYLIGNLLYGLYITSFNPRPDPVTHVVSEQTAELLNVCGYSVVSQDRQNKATTDILYMDSIVLSVFEGCNGINTMIIFLAFLFAFGPISKPLLWFAPLGLIMIHITNLLRISLLFFVTQYLPSAMYFTHKYFFTAILYVLIFGLWIWWVRRYANSKTAHASPG